MTRRLSYRVTLNRRLACGIGMLVCLVLTPFPGRTQPAELAEPPEAPSTPVVVDLEHQRQVDTCRDGLLDREARDEERKRWADLLLSYDTPTARELVVDLLRRHDRPRVQRVLCEAIGDRSRSAPDRVSKDLAAPLLDLLGAENEVLRSTAARTLADFPDEEIPARLGSIAADHGAPLPKRLAAVDALAPNTHQRSVVAQLIPLLYTQDVPQVVDRTVSALAPSTLSQFGADVEKWRTWWEVRSRWREEDWLAEQLEVYRRRSRQTADEFASFRASSQQSLAAVEQQYRSFQHELFRLLPKDQRDARLVEWLDSPLSLTNRTALAIIQARIADEGRRPEGDVLAALLKLLQRATGDTQREVIQIVQTLNAPMVVDAVLSLLERERDPKSRLAVIAAIGRLESPRAVPLLIREIADDRAFPECVREAAIALGTIAARLEGNDPSTIEVVEPLKRRYAALNPNDSAQRAALLSAMSGVGASAFTPELLAAMESDDPAVLQPALRGLLRLAEASKLSRFRSLTAHADPQVRLAAVEAVAKLGAEDADLENLLTRLNPGIETNALVRESAWHGFREYMGRRPIGERLRIADRLRDTPDLELRYLTELADDVNASDGAAAGMSVIDRLATTLMNQGKFADAAARWLQLFDARSVHGDAEAFDTGIRWLEAKLRAPAAGELPQLLERLAACADGDAQRERIRDVVQRYVQSPEFAADPSRARAILAELRAAEFSAWSEMLDRLERELTAERSAPSSQQ